MKKIFYIQFVLITISFSQFSLSYLKDYTQIKGRVSRINIEASLIRLRVRDKNLKFFVKNDQLEIFQERDVKRRCLADVMGKSNEYLLIRVSEMHSCLQRVGLVIGGQLYIKSEDLGKSIDMAQELIEILAKKRLALTIKLNKGKKQLNGYIEKVAAINDRYEVLRTKLEYEWRNELADLERDKINILKKFEELKSKINNVEDKMEKYRVFNKQSENDTWALDSKIYGPIY